LSYFKTTDEVISDFIIKHDNRYNYSKVKYKDNYNKVKIICKEHGLFEQLASNHRQGQGCPKCNIEQKLIMKYKNNIIKKEEMVLYSGYTETFNENILIKEDKEWKS